jgi:hypothetical protein
MAAQLPLHDRHDIVRRRLQNQRLIGKPFASPAKTVAWHVAMQSQDYGGAKWAVGQRTAGASDASVDAAFQRGEILRTHVLRPTWHFVAPADIRWLLQLSAPRIKALSAPYFRAPYFRKHGLDAAALRKSRRVLEKQLPGRQLTRDELALALAQAGLPTKGEALSYQMIAAELDALICSGARRGKQHTYALLEERVAQAPARSRDEALAELALRYLQGHGPALVQDLAWWSGLTIADAKRGVAACAEQLRSANVAGKLYWFAPLSRGAPLTEPVVHLLPNYDEQLIAYRYRRNAVAEALGGRVGPGDGVFDGHLVTVDGQVVGSWRRELGKTSVVVNVTTLRKLSRAERQQLALAARKYAAFVELELELSVAER